MSVRDYNIKKLMDAASELAIRTLIREEVQKDSSYSLLSDVRLGSRRLAKLVWTKLNELSERANRGCAYEKLSWESVREVVKDWKCDRIYVSDAKGWMQIWIRNNLYLLTHKDSELYVTSSEMATFPVKMSLDRLREMLVAFDAYLATDIHASVTSAITAYHAQLKANELLTTAALSMVSDMLDGKQLIFSIRQYKDRIYCEVKENRWWGEKVTFRTTLETLREDFVVACLKAEIHINLRSKNREYLQMAAAKRFEYRMFQDASFLSDADIYPAVRGSKILDDALVFGGAVHELFGADSNISGLHYASMVCSIGRSRVMTLHSPALLYFLSFITVSSENPLVIPIEGTPVKFTAVRFAVDEPIAGFDADNQPVYADINVKLISEDKETVLLLNSMFTEYLTLGKANRIDEHVYGKHYRKMSKPLQRLGLKFEQGSLMSVAGKTKVYAKGLHQLLVNALGASDHFDNARVYLATILYRFPDDIDGGKLENYTKAHKVWAKRLNSLKAISDVNVIETPFVYQEVFAGSNASFLPERVREFYKI